MSAKFSRQSPELKRQRFAWLDQILVDPELPASAFKVAYRIGQGFNDRDRNGEAYEGCIGIAAKIGMSKATVIEMVRRLHARGHLRIEWGQQGSGHSNNYWLILKGQPADLSDEVKGQPANLSDDKIKGQPADRKGQPADKSHSISQKESHGRSHTPRVAAPASSFSADQQACSAAVATEGSEQPAAGFKEFCAVYPKQTGMHAAEREYKKALQEGATAAEINDGARRYATDPERIERGDRYTKDPKNWLKERKWADTLTGVTIDENGNSVAAARPWKTTGSADAFKVGEQVKALIRANGGRI